MENHTYEPFSDGIPPRPFSTPHSALVGWLSSAAEADAAPPDSEEAEILPAPGEPDTLSPGGYGWTPFARRLFLQVLGETGRVSTACEYVRLTRQSAYALRARDPLFALGWDAAAEMARQPLADALYEKALDGVVETVSKDGKVVAERRRFDARLSMAVLNRLDKRCDQAAEQGSRHLALAARWDEWLALVGKGAEAEAAAFLVPPAGPAETAQQCQKCQIAEEENPIGDAAEEEEIDVTDRCWFDADEEVWMTDFPPPAGFTGVETRDYDDDDPEEPYVRACTDEEVALLEADEAADRGAERAEEERVRDALFAALKQQDDPCAGPEADVASP